MTKQIPLKEQRSHSVRPSHRRERIEQIRETREKRDDLFNREDPPEPFEFNESVAAVFEDMLERSVPLYRECQTMVVDWCVRFAREGTSVYDLGCSTGTLLARLAEKLPKDRGIRLVGLDNSRPMLDKAREKLKSSTLPCELVEADLDGDLDIEHAGVVVLNYTLQFISPERRRALLQTIHRGLMHGGCLVLVEKVRSESSDMDDPFVEMYHAFKRQQGYSDLEIAKKREALENVLIPWKLSENIEMLRESGFRSVEVFFKWNNFAGLVALK